MTDTDTAAGLNGQAPAPASEAPCDDCATSGERALAVFAFLFGAFIIGIAIDMFTGGRISGMVKEQTGGS